MYFRQFLDHQTLSCTYLLACPRQGKAVLIDPVFEDQALYLAVIAEMGFELTNVLETHLHADHRTAAALLREKTGASLGVSDPQIEGADFMIADAQPILVGQLELTPISTPGHTRHCISYHCEDRLFTGDCLWIDDCGSLCEADSDAGKMFDSITRKLFRFPEETLVYPGHAFSGRQVSCIGDERRRNSLFSGQSRDEFIARLAARPCPSQPAALLMTALNRSCGRNVSLSNLS